MARLRSHHPLSWIGHDFAFKIDFFFLLFLLSPEELEDSRNPDFLLREEPERRLVYLSDHAQKKRLCFISCPIVSAALGSQPGVKHPLLRAGAE